MHIAAKAASVGIALAVLGGCSTLQSLNPFASKPAPRNPPAALVDIKPSMNVRTAWSVNIGKAGTALFNPALVQGSVFVAAADGTIARLDAANGNQLWRINAGVPLTAGVGGSMLSIGSAAGVALMGLARGAYTFGAHLRWSWAVLLGYAAGVGTHLVLNQHLF